jgi:23S rRNA G2069 N7-methylase RlmK/C1962 C5-methylase RlmI
VDREAIAAFAVPQRSQRVQALLETRLSLGGLEGGKTDCVRLCCGLAEGLEGMLIDKFGSLLLAVDYRQAAEDTIDATSLADLVHRVCPDAHVVAKVRAAGEGSNTFVTAFAKPVNSDGTDLALVAYERGLSFEIRTDPAHDFGIFLDAAKARMFVRSEAANKRVLNLFSYAGAFGIAAAAGGAAEVTNIDPNRDYLAWSRRNAELNGLSMRVLPDTTQDFLAKHLRRLSRNPETPGFDLVIVDPPAFCVGRGDERLMRLLWPQVFASLRVMKPNQLVLLCNDKSFRSRQSFAELVQEELGSLYRFDRLGTCLRQDDLTAAQPNIFWKPEVQDPNYLEPVVLAGQRI